MLFALVYRLASGLSWVLRLSPILHADLLIAAPKVTQAVFAALGDYHTWKLGEKVYGVGSNEAWTVVGRVRRQSWLASMLTHPARFHRIQPMAMVLLH